LTTKECVPGKVAGRANEGATRSDAIREYNIVTEERETVGWKVVVL
jgi:hypothetical protein